MVLRTMKVLSNKLACYLSSEQQGGTCMRWGCSESLHILIHIRYTAKWNGQYERWKLRSPPNPVRKYGTKITIDTVHSFVGQTSHPCLRHTKTWSQPQTFTSHTVHSIHTSMSSRDNRPRRLVRFFIWRWQHHTFVTYLVFTCNSYVTLLSVPGAL